jgi:predicted transcriptional regulator/predicted flap endonuclease-1-like 5' DNA nuclease
MSNETPDPASEDTLSVPAGVDLLITVESADDFHNRTAEKLTQLEVGDQTPQDHVRSFSTAAQIRRVLTNKRLELIEEIMADPPESISALAERVDRATSDVHADLQFLADERIVDLKRDGRRVRPTIPYENIHIELTLPRDRSSDDREAAQEEAWDEFESEFAAAFKELGAQQQQLVAQSVDAFLDAHQNAEQQTIQGVQQAEQVAQTVQQQTQEVVESAEEAASESQAQSASEGESEGQDLESIEGLGATYADRLRSYGIESVEHLAQADSETIADAAEISEERATEWVTSAQSQA